MLALSIPLFSNFFSNLPLTFWVMLLTNKQTNGGENSTDSTSTSAEVMNYMTHIQYIYDDSRFQR